MIPTIIKARIQLVNTMSTKKDQRSLIARSKFDIINFLLTISGFGPVFDRPRVDGKKYSIIGVILAIIHICLNVYSDNERAEKQELYSFYFDNVMYGMITIKRTISFTYPLWIALGLLLQFNASTIFHWHLEKFDLYFKNRNVNVKGLNEKLEKFTIFALVVGILYCGGLLSVLSIFWWSLELIYHVPFCHMFNAIFYYMSFGLLTMKASKYLYGIVCRFNLFEEELAKYQ